MKDMTLARFTKITIIKHKTPHQTNMLDFIFISAVVILLKRGWVMSC